LCTLTGNGDVGQQDILTVPKIKVDKVVKSATVGLLVPVKIAQHGYIHLT